MPELRNISPEELKEILEDHEKWVESVRKEGMRANLEYTDLNGIDLSRKDIRGAVLKGANLKNSLLKETNLLQADLSKADLTEANLNNANLNGANLSEAILNKTKLDNADFTGALLKYVDFISTNLSGYSFFGANLSGANFSQGNLSNTNFMDTDLSDTSLVGTNLMNANFVRANLSNAYLPESNLCGALLFWANLSGANLNKTDLSKADLRHAQLSYCDLSGATLTGAKVFGAGGAPIKAEGVSCDWLDFSQAGDGSDIRKPGSDRFEDIFQTLEPEIIVTSDINDPDLFAGLSGLAKAMQLIKARISKVEDTPSGGTAITFTTSEEENIIPVVIVLFNAFVKDGKIDLEILSRDVEDLKKIVVNDKLLFDLLKDLPGLIDLPHHYCDGLEKLRRGFVSQEIKIRGEYICIRRKDDKLHLDYRPSPERPQIEDKYGSMGKDFAKTFISSAAGAAASTLATSKAMPVIIEVLKNLIK